MRKFYNFIPIFIATLMLAFILYGFLPRNQSKVIYNDYSDCQCGKTELGCVGDYVGEIEKPSVNEPLYVYVSLSLKSDYTYSLFDGDDFYYGEWNKDEATGDTFLFKRNGRFLTVFDCSTGLINIPSVGKCRMRRE